MFMIKFRKTTIILTLLALSSCNFRPYGPGLHSNSSNKCSRIVESTQRANCYDRVNDSYSRIQERMDKIEREESKKEKLLRPIAIMWQLFFL